MAASSTTATLPRIDLKSSQLGKEAAFKTWRAAVPQYAISIPNDDLTDFAMDLSAWLLQKIVFTHGHTSPCRLERKAESLSDGYDNIVFLLFMKGLWVGEADGRPFSSEDGDICLLDASKPFHVVTTQASYAMVNVPRQTFMEAAPDVTIPHGHILRSASGWILAEHLTALCRYLPNMHKAEAERMAAATLTLMASSLAELTGTDHLAKGSLISAVRLRVERHIERHIGSPDLTPDMICHELDIPRSTLYRAFSPFGGILSYIQKRRLDAARALLFHPEEHRSVGEIAQALGFGNVTSFTRSFERQFGCSPREARQSGSTYISSSQMLFEHWRQAVARGG
ncbi:helix-turn-helix domain-containing protein [Aureimonas sp. N4]|uniref:helix-turn-helix domain-containing protein n=1 Tax=Aureimonas sp. N4 TaxID=1638165 RepID=UPI000780EB31|nr:helix-turn-helix domain-containing protein [Aureimonas sp. N4]